MPKKSTGKRNLITLFDGCYCSQFKVFPKNWNDTGADASLAWYIRYRFYDPAYKHLPKYTKGKLCIVKGMNEFSNLTEKREHTRDLLKQEMDLVIKEGFNPITRKFMAPVEEVETAPLPDLHPQMLFIDALKMAKEKRRVRISEKTYEGLGTVVKFVSKAAVLLRMDRLPIGEVKRVHIRSIFDQLAIIKGEAWTDSNFNHYRAYTSILFDEMEEWEAIDYNPIKKIAKRKEIRKKQRVLNEDERILVDRVLRRDNYPFWRFMLIFFKSGCRISEIMTVKGEDVDLKRQVFKALRKKGNGYVEVEYTITDSALPLWQEVIWGRTPNGDYSKAMELKMSKGCRPTDYVFSDKLLPGIRSINPKQISRRWMYWIKSENKFNIKASFYSLKHLHTTMTVDKYGTSAAAQFNNESEKMIIAHYDVNHEQRQHSSKKNNNNQFSPGSL